MQVGPLAAIECKVSGAEMLSIHLHSPHKEWWDLQGRGNAKTGKGRESRGVAKSTAARNQRRSGWNGFASSTNIKWNETVVSRISD